MKYALPKPIRLSLVSFSLLMLVVGSACAGLVRKAPHLIYPDDNTQMQLVWQLYSTATCTVQWGLDTLYSLGSTLSNEYGSDHQHAYTITELAPSTKYFYRVIAGTDTCAGSFRAAPPHEAYGINFIAYGDTRTYPADHDQVAAGVVSTFDTDENFQSLIVSVGDLVADGDEESDWDSQFFDPYYSNIQTMLASVPYQVAMGNHEGSGVLFTKYFPYPFVADRYWSFDYGPAHFVVVDQYTHYGSGSAQLDWIDGDLAATTKPWRFLCLHEPGWSAGGHGNNAAVQDNIQPLCEQYGVSVVFAGHNHYYARAQVNGVTHVTTGGGGAPLYAPDATYPNVITATMAHHYCKVEIDGNLLTLTAVTSGGDVIDEFTIENPLVSVSGKETGNLVLKAALHPAYPNPFGPSTHIAFSVFEPCEVLLRIYDVNGRPVRTLVDDWMDAGRHGLAWDGRDDAGRAAASGVYVCRLQTAGRGESRKIVLLR
ncbi:MAG: hypothetical protein AMJ46_01235 [Latescibacteria bacterium DG_63]|nr:MAG: hypothetical protein AMJ46_01235 [Latescibacteria bacterium DG_63]